MSDWRPIETYDPSFGDLVIICDPAADKVGEGMIADAEERFGGERGWVFVYEVGAAVTAAGIMDFRYQPATPTHWMPMPELPDIESRSSGA